MAVDAIERVTVTSTRSSLRLSRHGVRRRGRQRLRRPPVPRAGQTRTAPRPLRPQSPAEQQRRLDIAARALVRTIRACPAPGVPPLRRRDWLAIAAVVAVPAAILFVAGLTGSWRA